MAQPVLSYKVMEPKAQNQGFTLVELMVATLIIGILVGLSVAAMSGAKKSARDGKRKADLEQIRSALEMYKADNNTYVSWPDTCDSSIGVGSTCPIDPPGSDWGGTLETVLETPPGYISDLPTDPLNNSTYYYYYRAVCDTTGTGATGNVCGVSKTCIGLNNCCAYELGVLLETTGVVYRVCNP